MEESNLKKYQFHPVANIFPLCDQGSDFEAFVEDISRNGLLQPIVLHEGMILDGRRRYLACRKAGISPSVLVWDGIGLPIDFVISVNALRRQLSHSQLAVAALKSLPFFQKNAKDRQRLSKGRAQKGARLCATLKGKATEWAAKRFGIGVRLVEMAKKVQDARSNLIAEIDTGRMTVSEAYETVAPGKSQDHDKLSAEAKEPGVVARSIKGAGDQREALDSYPTPPHAIASLLRRERFDGTTWECASGDGRIVRMMRSVGYDVVGTDIKQGIDFLLTNKVVDNIVTNPPFDLKNEFIAHAKKSVSRKIAFLLPLEGLDTVGRFSVFQDRDFPLKCIYVFSRRLNFDPGRTDMGMMSHAWFVWDRSHEGEPMVRWVDPEEAKRQSLNASEVPPSHSKLACTPDDGQASRDSAEDDRFQTPKWLFDALNNDYDFRLDACAEKEVAKCSHYFSPEQDSLRHGWAKFGSIFCNPPYNWHHLERWVVKGFLEAQKGATVVMLLPYFKSYSWFRFVVIPFAEIRQIQGLVIYPGYGNQRGKCAGNRGNRPFDTVVAVFRKGQQGFNGSYVDKAGHDPPKPPKSLHRRFWNTRPLTGC